MKYMIHTHPKRLWYVNDYLVPSMIKQGINPDNIFIFNDSNKRGNLQSFLDSLDWILNNYGYAEIGFWHLQDDVIICKNFKEITEDSKVAWNHIVNGFVSSDYNSQKLKLIGWQDVKNSWLSFPCVYIPNKLIYGFMCWIDKAKTKDNKMEYKRRYESNRHDDFFFYEFLRRKHKEQEVLNLKPNLVDHIDYLVGGSINKPREKQVRGYYFEDLDLVEKLERKLKNEK